MTGRIFEIREFTLHDGPGVRTTVFFKGCPLHCAWCHNPEGQSFDIETMTRRDGTKVSCGQDWTAEALAKELVKNADIMKQSGGGVTFSGGEPLAQGDFVLQTMAAADALNGDFLHFAIETSGYVDDEMYDTIIHQMDFVYQDLKHHDAASFKKWCGGDLSIVLRNVEILKRSSIPHVFRVPCIPGVNDSAADRAAFLRLAGDASVEFLPYNAAAGAKYAMLGRTYSFAALNNQQERKTMQ